jgi:hypothetical protein
MSERHNPRPFIGGDFASLVAGIDQTSTEAQPQKKPMGTSNIELAIKWLHALGYSNNPCKSW